jgi:hypothetical protein
VEPSRAFTLKGVGGFQPIARRADMSAFSRVRRRFPSESRTTEIGGTSGFE